eukprot:GHVS01060497.1.p1 GENE.GHVS01060497.1~~GHVS01060497.1.p1  ORF type:complete len:492 (+),score=136.37 GHVS01060497.1:84-1559(+)
MHPCVPTVRISRPTFEPVASRVKPSSSSGPGSLEKCCSCTAVVWLCSQWAPCLPGELPTEDMVDGGGLVGLLVYDGQAFYQGSINLSNLSSQVQWHSGSLQRLLRAFTQTPSDKNNKLTITNKKPTDSSSSGGDFWLSVLFVLDTATDLEIAAVPDIPLVATDAPAVSQLFTAVFRMQNNFQETVDACKVECSLQSDELRQSNGSLTSAVAEREKLKTEMLSKFAVILNSIKAKNQQLRQQLKQQQEKHVDDVVTEVVQGSTSTTGPSSGAASSCRRKGRLRIEEEAEEIAEPTDELLSMIRIKQEEETNEEERREMVEGGDAPRPRRLKKTTTEEEEERQEGLAQNVITENNVKRVKRRNVGRNGGRDDLTTGDVLNTSWGFGDDPMDSLPLYVSPQQSSSPLPPSGTGGWINSKTKRSSKNVATVLSSSMSSFPASFSSYSSSSSSSSSSSYSSSSSSSSFSSSFSSSATSISSDTEACQDICALLFDD